MRRYAAACVSVLFVVCAVGTAHSGDGDLLWSEVATGEAGTYRGCWTSAAGKGLVFVGGQNETAAASAAFSVWAYRQRDGALVWEDHYDREGDNNDNVQALALRGKRLVVVGSTRTDAGGAAWTVRTYDARNGDLLWDDEVDVEGALVDTARGVAIRGRTVYVVGGTETSAGGLAFTVRAMDLRDGSLLWDDAYDHEDRSGDVAVDVAVLGRRVVVVGHVSTVAGRNAAAVRTYDGRNGNLLWHDELDAEGDGTDGYGDVAVTRGIAFAAGTSHTAAGSTAMTVRAFKVRDGQLVWEDAFDREGAGDDRAESVAARGNLVLVGGDTHTTAGNAFSVRAYGAKDGSLLWEHHRSRPPDAVGFDRESVETVQIGRGRAYAIGTTGNAADGQGLTVVALSARTGDLLWDDRFDHAPGNNDDISWTAIQSGRRLFVSGEAETATGDYVVPVRAYKAR